ncbi:hypothetical protein H9L13_08220 [Sphingomonas lutea]|uniref:Photosynthesis system II assembly factor Ycf48/Hcf136-like domain-containing protein n=1 Tax=Sphingomonas lutea TaxID=1045317 RepID=A0A7G9SFQ1_9SPHN|nr:hypothetical protein [Sphingomonas lutea]QNN66676.1 hypothetical protein H9L13_08220 [Sphingomonas lutea]
MLMGRYLAVALAIFGAAAQAAPAKSPTAAQLADRTWQTLPTEAYKGKRDDIHFADARTGFYGTGAGDLFRTDDGGRSWTKVWSRKGTFIRALGFVDAKHGFMGNVGDYYPGVTDRVPLYETKDGGASWAPVDLGGVIVEGICAIDVLRIRSIYQGELRDSAVIHAAGRVGGPAKLLRSVDGGRTWSYLDLSAHAGMILDVKFIDARTGFVFAGSNSDIKDSEALILKTTNGGRTWRPVYRSGRKLENSWKGSFVNARTGFATVQTYDPERTQQVIVRTTNGGETWRELPLVSDAKARQFGIGFATEQVGWVGTAAGGFETRDGGRTWKPAPIAKAANKIRVKAADGTPMIVAIGTEVQALSTPSTP